MASSNFFMIFQALYMPIEGVCDWGSLARRRGVLGEAHRLYQASLNYDKALLAKVSMYVFSNQNHEVSDVT